MYKIALCLLGVLYAAPVLAYVGPGLGAGTLGVIAGFIGSIFLALFAIIWYPVKRLLKRIRGSDKQKQKQKATDSKQSKEDSEHSAQ